VLINADLTKLSGVLNPNTDGIVSRATKSTRSPVQNIATANADITFDKVMNAIGYEFLRPDKNGNDGGEKMIEKQRGFQFLNPSNEWFPGIGQIRSELESWDHVYGRTPEFTVNREYAMNSVGAGDLKARLSLQVSKGRVTNASVELPAELKDLDESGLARKLLMFSNELKGVAFHFDLIRDFEAVLFKQDSQVSSSNESHRGFAESLLIV
jgi:lipoyltransferase 1